MNRNFWAMGIVAGCIISFVNVARAEGIKEGKWAMSMVTRVGGMQEEMAAAMKEMDGMSPEDKALMQQMMGNMNIPTAGEDGGITTNMTKCVTNSDPVPQMETDEGCVSTHAVAGDTVHFETTCPDGTSTGEVTYTDESMHGTITSHSTESAEAADVTIEISGVYEGPCDAQ